MSGRRQGEIVDDIAGLRRLLARLRVIAVVGLSQHWYRPSYFAAKYMLDHGYTVVPVNPGYAECLGQKAYPSLDAIPGPVAHIHPEILEDLEAFRASDAHIALELHRRALALRLLRVIPDGNTAMGRTLYS